MNTRIMSAEGMTGVMTDEMTDEMTEEMIKGVMAGMRGAVTAPTTATAMKSPILALMMTMDGSQSLARGLKAGFTKFIVTSFQLS